MQQLPLQEKTKAITLLILPLLTNYSFYHDKCYGKYSSEPSVPSQASTHSFTSISFPRPLLYSLILK